MRPSRLIFLLVFLLVLAVCAPRIAIWAKDFFAAAQEGFISERLVLPMWIDYAAVFIFGITGTMTARAKGYDFVGAFVLGGITAMGGALLRDGLCIQCDISPLFTESGYILSLLAAWLVGMFFGEFFMKFDNFMIIIDAAGLGLYTVFGTDKAILYDLSVPVAVGIGILNGVGGGLLRDVIARDEPMVFKPGQFYTAVAALASVLYVALHGIVPPTIAAAIVVFICVVVRLLVVHYDLHSQSVAETQERVRRFLKAVRETHNKEPKLPEDFFSDIDKVDDWNKTPPNTNSVDPDKKL